MQVFGNTCKFTPLGFETRTRRYKFAARSRVNLPRWGLKRESYKEEFFKQLSVNLPRWGLKLNRSASATNFLMCKFTPLGFETCSLAQTRKNTPTCKFTPLGFETHAQKALTIGAKGV